MFSATVKDGRELEVLVHHADAGSDRLGGPREGDGHAAQIYFARGSLQQPVEDVHERRLAGAILADEGVNLARTDLQRRVADRDEIAEVLHDPAHGDEGGSHRTQPAALLGAGAPALSGRRDGRSGAA